MERTVVFTAFCYTYYSIVFCSRSNLFCECTSMRDERFDKGKEQKKIIRSFAFYNVGIFLLWCSFVGLLSLQSSINIENGLGKQIGPFASISCN